MLFTAVATLLLALKQLHQLRGNVGGLQQFQASIAGNAAKGLQVNQIAMQGNTANTQNAALGISGNTAITQATAFCSRQHSGTQNIAAGVQGNTAFTQANQANLNGAVVGNVAAAQSNNVLFNQNAGVNQFSTGAIGTTSPPSTRPTPAPSLVTLPRLVNKTSQRSGNAATNQQNMFGIGSNIAGVQANGINAAGNGFQVDVSKNIVA
ncbi:hypothetical protein BC829DRAFT_384837 [Chytridium lagenaria]|nr:hypothetical protein BC829DRAFT_384837 [Chytridium lagenaria]